MTRLSYYMHDGPATFRFELAGDLAGNDVDKLEQAWRTATSTMDGKILAVDVTYITTVDEKGRRLLERWRRADAHFVAGSTASRHLVESITGQPYAAADSAVGPTFDPRFTAGSLRGVLVAMVIAITLLFPANASAVEKLDPSSAVLERYSSALPGGGLDNVPVSVEVDASLPKFEKRARVSAIRTSDEGKREYRFIAQEGDSFVRKEMIGRYFAMDKETVPLGIGITKSNYKFHFVAMKGTAAVFQITPRRKRQGAIAGEMWIDTETGLVTHLAGRLVKSPSVMLRHVDLIQETEIRDGRIQARETHLNIDTRFTGRAELTIRERAYSAEMEVAENAAP